VIFQHLNYIMSCSYSDLPFGYRDSCLIIKAALYKPALAIHARLDAGAFDLALSAG
jgi:hypothetical protein